MTVTQAVSVDYVNSQLGVGGEYEGWRYASLGEAQTLLTRFGLPIEYNSYYSPVPNYIADGVNDAVSFLGEIIGNGSDGESGVGGYTGDLNGVNPYYVRAYSIQNSSSYHIHLTGMTYGSTSSQYVESGSFLVMDSPSPVPIPAAIWLFGTGLLGLVRIARRKKTA